METTTEIIGYHVIFTYTGAFVDHNEVEGNFITPEAPKPLRRGDAFRRLAAFLDDRPDQDEDEYKVVPVYRKPTPIETAADELGRQLESLCARHGLDLGLSKEQIRTQIARELADFGAVPKALR